MNREPFFGPNAKPMLTQTLIGVVVATLAYWATAGWLEPAVKQFSCTYISGSCRSGN